VSCGSAGSVSCASPGNCSAGGDYYTDAAGHQQAFVVSEKNGSWGTAAVMSPRSRPARGFGIAIYL
jgi:hypothetical protein